VVRRAAADRQAAAAKKMADLLESEKAGYDVGAYRDAPPGLRIWCGATVEQRDLEALLPLAGLGLLREIGG
jgi:phosphoserine aminotransferase